MANFQSSSEIRAQTRNQLAGYWGLAILISLIYTLINLAPQFNEITGIIGALILTGPLSAGMSYVCLKFARRETVVFEDMFKGFYRFVDFFVLNLLMTIFILLWALLLIVPGIIAAFRYSQAYFLMIDDPNLQPLDAIKKSSLLMLGHKARLFYLFVSFIGWILLSILTFGIGFIVLYPYILTAQANFYDQLKAPQSDNSAQSANPIQS